MVRQAVSGVGMALAVALVLASPATSHAGLIDGASEAKLEAWLGQGDLAFTNIFTKCAMPPTTICSGLATGYTASDFHRAVDGKGATFTLMEATFYGPSGPPATHIIGGYNPRSWSSIGNYNYTVSDSERTAFIYNLTTDVKQSQRLNSDPYAGGIGQFQTHNYPGAGPVFGGGHDLWVAFGLNDGYARQYSYGVGASNCHVNSQNILNNQTSCPGQTYFTIGALEVYTFAPAAVAVPDSASTFMLLSSALAGMAVFRARR